MVDQFEEIFAYRKEHLVVDGGAGADRFIALLLRATEQTEIPIYVMLTMRSDFLGECAVFRGLPEALNEGHYLVPKMTRLQLQEAIEGPLGAVGAEIHPSVVQRLLNECEEEPDSLPVLQHLLWRMFEEALPPCRRAEDRCNDARAQMVLSPTAYEKAGELKGAIDQDAEGVLARFPADQTAIRTLFQRITERGEGDKPIRKPETMSVLSEITGLTTARLRGNRRGIPRAKDCWFKGGSRMARSKLIFRTSVLPGSGSD